MNLPNLLVNVHSLHSLQILPLLQLPIITRRRLFPARRLLLADHRLPGHTVKDVAALRRQPLEVRRDVAGGEVSC